MRYELFISLSFVAILVLMLVFFFLFKKGLEWYRAWDEKRKMPFHKSELAKTCERHNVTLEFRTWCCFLWLTNHNRFRDKEFQFEYAKHLWNSEASIYFDTGWGWAIFYNKGGELVCNFRHLPSDCSRNRSYFTGLMFEQDPLHSDYRWIK